MLFLNIVHLHYRHIIALWNQNDPRIKNVPLVFGPKAQIPGWNTNQPSAGAHYSHKPYENHFYNYDHTPHIHELAKKKKKNV